MLPLVRSPLGAPGVFALPEVRQPALHPQRMDVCAFVGVAPRGPAQVPVVDQDWPAGYRMVTDAARPLRRSVAVPVRSFDEYLHLFGGFEGPGLLPHAVASYFEQGGRLAWIVRIVHAGPGAKPGDGCAMGMLRGAFIQDLPFLARNAGSWGNTLRVNLALTASTISFVFEAGAVLVDAHSPLALGCTVRFTNAAGVRSLSLVTSMRRVRDPARARERLQLTFDSAPVAPVRAELVEARIEISDGQGRRESFEHLALAPDHPNSLANVLCERATLVWPHPDWAGLRLVPADPQLEFARAVSGDFSGGTDGWSDIVGDDYFDPRWTPADEVPGNGICALAQTASVTQLVVPDLFLPAQWAGPEEVEIAPSGGAGAEFAACVAFAPAARAGSVAPSALTGLILDPRTAAGLDTITRLQQRVVEFCDSTQNHIALIDVPPGLSQGRIEQWRAGFDSAWAAAYHPWLVPARRKTRRGDSVPEQRRQLPPSATAAGIVARREFERGIQYGPANEIAREIVHLAEAQPAGRADALHPLSINCFVRQPDGIGLIAARTLSRESDWRQLSVRRLMLMLRRTLLADTQWAVFEPNGPALWRDLQHAIESLLRALFRAGAFAGRTEAESFFVRIHAEAVRQDRGELLVEIGVAPAEPLEFILVRLRRDGDGTLSLEE
uniref:phage tail sheath C-terminal domain-containing protein n=1 Tax=Cupriavidus yeoncheonensis TaxID=1462994 RepID=UPI003F4946AF